jgi:ubiquinone/menaquinone biosynthesis C-methylase UbiE
MSQESMVFDDFEPPYDRYATAYRDWWGPVIAPSALRLLASVGLPSGDTRQFEIVDVGTGTGTLALGALARWPEAQVTGVDPSNRMLELAAAAADQMDDDAARRLRLLQGNFDRLPLASGSMDVAVSSFVIQLIPSRAAGLREIRRILRPGGRFACVTWQAESNPFEPDDAFVEAVDELEIDLPPMDHDARPYTSPEAASSELRRDGFGNVQARVEWLEHPYTPETFLDVLEHWIESDLFEGLEPEMRDRLRQMTLEKLRPIPSDAFVWRRPLISVVGDRR